MPLRLYPAEDFLGLRRVLMTVPSASTTVRLITQSFMVPYLTALVPEQLVPTMPPIFALGPTEFKLTCDLPYQCVCVRVYRGNGAFLVR